MNAELISAFSNCLYNLLHHLSVSTKQHSIRSKYLTTSNILPEPRWKTIVVDSGVARIV